MDDLTDRQLREMIAAKIGRDTIPDATWDVLVGRGHVRDFLTEESAEEMLAEYARALTFYGDLVEQAEAPLDASVERTSEADAPRFGEYETQRSETLVEFLELKVAADPAVLTWRRDCWGSPEPLSAEEAYRLAEEQGHKSHLAKPQDVDLGEVRPSGYLWFFTGEAGEPERFEYYEGSLFERLHDVSQKLTSQLFSQWTLAEAAWAVVTGEVRKTPPCLMGEAEMFSNGHLSYGTINLRVEPWIAADTVLKTYQYLQALTLGRKPRAISQRTLALSKFVMRRLRNLIAHGLQSEAELGRVSWRKLMNQWNRSHPDWAYEDERRFYRDCHRTIRALVRPYDAVPSASGHSDPSARISIPQQTKASIRRTF